MKIYAQRTYSKTKSKNPSTGEFDWDVPWWNNTAILDNHPGILIATSETLPEDPWLGQHVFITDTMSLLAWNGNIWVNQSSGVFDFLKAGTGGVNWGDVVYINDNKRINKADNSMDESFAYRVLGLVMRDLEENEGGLVKKAGLLRNPGWSLSSGQEYYLGKNGRITENKPESGFVQCLGVAIAADTLSINIFNPLVDEEKFLKSNSRQITVAEQPPDQPEIYDLWFDIS